MKEALMMVCVLLIGWCISKMMPEYDDSKEYGRVLGEEFVLLLLISVAVMFRYSDGFRPLLSMGLALITFIAVNIKEWIQLRKKKDLVF